MVFSKDNKVVCKVLYQEKGQGMKTFINEFPNRNWSLSLI